MSSSGGTSARWPECSYGSIDAELVLQSVRQDLLGRSASITVGRYELKSLLGEGGMGKVYRAHDPQLDRAVAVKILRRNRTRSNAHGLTEARSVALLQHPNVVNVFDCGIEGERAYVVMELIEGVDLLQWMNQRRRSWREVVEVFVQAAHGLAAAHRQRLIHRDFKPSNVLVGRDGRVRVVDFGLAMRAARPRLVHDDESDVEQEYSSGSASRRVGTLAYMAPEVRSGQSATASSDQFSFCVALHEALFGRRPFPVVRSYELDGVETEYARSPWWRHGAPRALERLVLQGTAQRPGDRHESLESLARGLQKILGRRRKIIGVLSGCVLGALTFALLASAQEPVAHPCHYEDELWPETRRREVRQAIARSNPRSPIAVSRSMDILAGYADSWERTRVESCEATTLGEQSELLNDLRGFCLDRSRRPFDSLVDSLTENADVSAHELIELLDGSMLDPERECAASIVGEREGWANSLQMVTDGNRSFERRQITGRLESEILQAQLMRARGQRTQAHQTLERIIAEARSVGLRFLEAKALYLRFGYRTAELKDAERAGADTQLEAAKQLAIQARGHDLVVEILIARARLRVQHLDQFEDGLRDAHSFAMLTGRPSWYAGRIAYAHGARLADAEDWSEAIVHFEDAVELGRALDGPAPRWASDARNDLAAAYLSLGELAKAKASWQVLLETLEREGDEGDPLRAVVLANLGEVALRIGEGDDALRHYRAALRELKDQTECPMDPTASCVLDDRLRILIKLGRAHRTMGRVGWARRLLLGAVEEARVHGRNSQVLLEAYDQLGELALQRGDLDDAGALARRQFDVAQASYGPWGHTEVSRARLMLGKVHLRRGRLQEAYAILMAARSWLLEAAPGGALHAELSRYCAEAAMLLGDRDAAVRLMTDAITVLQDMQREGALERSRDPADEYRMLARDWGLEPMP